MFLDEDHHSIHSLLCMYVLKQDGLEHSAQCNKLINSAGHFENNVVNIMIHGSPFKLMASLCLYYVYIGVK